MYDQIPYRIDEVKAKLGPAKNPSILIPNNTSDNFLLSNNNFFLVPSLSISAVIAWCMAALGPNGTHTKPVQFKGCNTSSTNGLQPLN